MYCAIVWPHLEYAMELKLPNWRGSNALQRQLNLFSLGRRRLRADLILAFKIFTGKVDLSPPDFFLRSPPPSRAECTSTDYCMDPAVFDVEVVHFLCVKCAFSVV